MPHVETHGDEARELGASCLTSRQARLLSCVQLADAAPYLSTSPTTKNIEPRIATMWPQLARQHLAEHLDVVEGR